MCKWNKKQKKRSAPQKEKSPAQSPQIRKHHGKIKLHRQRRNHSMGKDKKCSRKDKTEKLKNKDCTGNTPNQNKNG